MKKKENSLYRVRGRKLHGEYFAFETALGGNRGGGYCPMVKFRDVPWLWDLEAESGVDGLRPVERKLGRFRYDDRRLPLL